MNETLNTIINTPLSDITDEMLIILNDLHFLRADWFYAFIPLLIYLILYSKKAQSNKNWQSVIDQKLLPFVLTKSGGKRRRYPVLLTFIAASLCITALAGPVYKKLTQPVYREQSSLIVLLDLSKSMNAADIKPSRLSRAKLELLDILKTRKTGQTALIVYAADAFVVTPLTDDNATIANLTPSLETDMMPAQGSNLSKALAKAFALFNQAGIIKGNVLLITDDIRAQDKSAIEKIQSQGHRLSIFGIGTTEGAPIPLHDSATGGFLQDNNGAIVIPKLQPAKLQQYALMGSGIYTSLKADDSDTLKLTKLFQSKNIANTESKQDANADTWQEEGHWLLTPLLLFAALWARRGWIAALLPFAIVFTSAIPQPAFAESSNQEPSYFNSNHLWSSPDQKAMQSFEAGDNENAAAAFTQLDWKASALYRNGDYQQAAKLLENTSSSDGHYNRANALAKLEQYKEAIKAYDKALTLDENNEDAKYNREQVKQALKKQQKNSEQDKSEQDKEKQEEENKDSENKESGEQQDTNSQQSESEQQEDKQDGDDQQTSEENKNPEQQQSADKELQQRDADKEREEEKKEQQQYEQDQKDQQQEDQNQQQSDSVENKDTEDNEAEQDPTEIEINPMEASITEDEKATEQWLKRIPDDPGGLLRRKFLYQYKRKPNQSDTNEPW